MKNRIFIAFIVILCVAGMISFEIISPSYTANEHLNQIIQDILVRLFGSILFFVLIFHWYRNLLIINADKLKSLPAVIPCFIVALNNLPTVALLTGDATIAPDVTVIVLYTVECLFVGIFEEFTFRGVLFSVILEKHCQSKKEILYSILISSAIFGLVHIVNLFYGSGIGPVLLQVGYSFLIGCMCSFVMIQTGNVFFAAAVHAIYDFCGGVVPEAGSGEMVNTPQIILTSLIAVLCTAYIIISLKKFDVGKVQKLYHEVQHAS